MDLSTDEIPVEALVVGGQATSGPPLGPALGPLGVPAGQVVAKINELTQEFAGLKVPVVVWVDKSKKPAGFRIEVKNPPTSALILREIGAEKGSGTPNDAKAGDLSVEGAVKLAKMKRAEMNVKDLKAAVKTVLGTCVSTGVTVDGGKDPRIVQQAIDDGEYDDLLKE
ncbi:MAG: 50S ribosomal protein L11 [Candidatus Lokiarchaeota archaeon]|nr:50S ribosomal protein L11 [Candidatus Lokiarchaeota archaeon]